MDIVEGDLHDPLSATYQTLELARLNDALKECGVAATALRRRICETFFFNSGYFLDSRWFADQESRFQPGVYFTEVDESGSPTGKVFMPDPDTGTMFHEYAHGAAAWLFEDHAEDASEKSVSGILPPDCRLERSVPGCKLRTAYRQSASNHVLQQTGAAGRFFKVQRLSSGPCC